NDHRFLRFDLPLGERFADRLPHETFALQRAISLDALRRSRRPRRGTKRRQLPAKAFDAVLVSAVFEQAVPGFLPGAIARDLGQLFIETAFDDQAIGFLLDRVSRGWLAGTWLLGSGCGRSVRVEFSHLSRL